MKVIITYPPLETRKTYPTLGQNRQYQEFSKKTTIYPIVPAQAATLLKEAGHQVIWNDCLAQGLSSTEFLDFIQREKPDLIALETKTPVVKQHWKTIKEIKDLFPNGNFPKIALFGDHVSALPQESFQNSLVDFVLTGGDYDFLLLSLCNSLNRISINKYQLTINNLEPGIWYRDNGQIRNTGPFSLNHNLDTLPFIDRDLTQWQLYAYENGNYKRRPGTYIMAGRDCSYGQCSFCSWSQQLYTKFRARNPTNVLDEIELLVQDFGVREIMDDTGSFPVGDWLRDFCAGLVRRGLNRKIYFDCNMRFGALSNAEFRMLKETNFRLILFGLESANQKTLDRINKNVQVLRIIEDCKAATVAGLFPHLTIMFGYPWEDYSDAQRTLNLARWLLKKGYAYTVQATIVIPYPGTPLFAECKENSWLRTLDWDNYDMKQPVMKSQIPDDKITELVQSMYKVSFLPEFMLRRFFSLRDADDIRYSVRAAKKVLGHIFDFKGRRFTSPF